MPTTACHTCTHAHKLAHTLPQTFACVVGQKPSRAPLYLNDHHEVLELLAKMAGVQLPPRVESFNA